MANADFKGFSPNSHLLAGELPAPAQLKSRWDVLTGGAVVPALVILILFIIATRTKVGEQVKNQVIENFVMVMPVKPGPGGGGGGRPKDPAPPRKAEIKPSETKPVPTPSPVPTPDMNIPVQTPQAVETIPGAATALDAGIGAAGGGKGNGIGTGNGNGVGPGEGGGYGGGAYQIGNGVTSPVLIREVRPNYTGDAMRAKLQGVVEMECIVNADGSVDAGHIKILKSLDDRFGLDEEAKKAVRQWRFRPGTFKGQAVPVIVDVELTFTLR
jgi:protein TonB